MDACTTAQAMWQRVECLMRGIVQNMVDRETCFNNEFDKFVAGLGEALVSVYNRFAQLMNDLERNEIKFPLVTVNTKFLNCLQPEWLKYVTQVCLAKRLTEDSYDDFFDYLQQFEKLVNVSRAKKLEKSHNPLALVAHMGSSSSTTSPYYVIHPSSVVDYDEDYQGDAVQNTFEDLLTSPTEYRFKARILVMVEEIQDIHMFKRKLLSVPMFRLMLETYRELFELRLQELLQIFNATNEKGHYARNSPKPRVQDSKKFMEQMLLAKQDEARVILTVEYNDFLFVDAS
ncbi:hypothetical protein Tco_0971250 [Tanacetum coccineum]